MADSISETHHRYFVADTWVLVNYTYGKHANSFSNLLNQLDLRILVDTHTLIELYNPEWYRLPFIGRTRNAAEFLSDHPSLIVDPQQVILYEVRAYPSTLIVSSIATDLHSMHWSIREYLLRGLFRREKDLVRHGLDLEVWSEDYKNDKANWSNNVRAIIDDATSSGLLVKSKDGTIDLAASDKEGFLQYLDRRFLKFDFHCNASHADRVNLAETIRELSYGSTSKLPALRLTSLCFWHAYVQIDKSYPMPPKGSDLGDLYRIALVPYSDYFTVDSAMERVLLRALADYSKATTILGPASIDRFLEDYRPEPGELLRY